MNNHNKPFSIVDLLKRNVEPEIIDEVEGDHIDEKKSDNPEINKTTEYVIKSIEEI